MVLRKVSIKESITLQIAKIAWFIESRGLVLTAEKFSDSIYDFIEKLADARRNYAVCREPERAFLGYKCVSFKRKYSIIFLETDDELIICEFIPSKNIHW